ncbi:MAG: aspartate carbamoyltransferase regulatory subunit [Bacteroidaceae bacterium]|nr:aspartate carbamoyltransferase regulatory subunit [Bacteroidaceae bacterium]
MNQELMVAAIENGTVIDHIPCNKLFEVISLLGLQAMTSTVMIGYNLASGKMGSKSLIKISDRFFSDEELNRLAVVAPNVNLSIIRNFEVVEKRQVEMPSPIVGVVKCANPKCITNNEPMRTRFDVSEKKEGVIRCHYCGREQLVDTVKLV